MDATYAIYSEGGQELTVTSMGYRESRAMAQELADEMGETVYLDTVPSRTSQDNDEDCGEAIAPRQPPATTYRIIAVLPDGQQMADEVHIGQAAGRVYTTRDEAEREAAHLDDDRPEGHEDVEYRVVEAE